MRKFSLLLLIAFLTQNVLASWAESADVELKAEQPIADTRAETKFLFARISQIEKAQIGDKLPLKLTGKVQIANAKPVLKANLRSTKLALETPANQPLKKSEKRLLTTSTSQQMRRAKIDFNDVYAGQLKLTANHQFSDDPSLNIRLNAGERGFTLIRFEKSANGNFKLHPPAIFFAGRNLPSSQMKEQQQRFDDPYADTRQISLVDNGIKNLSNWFPWFANKKSNETKIEHLNYVYVPLGNIESYNKLGHYYLNNVVSTDTRLISDKSLAQDEVTEVQTNDPASPTRYYESAIRFDILDAGKAHMRVARVQYSENRSILSSQIFEGDVTTSEVPTVQADISSYTKKTWNQVSTEFRL